MAERENLPQSFWKSRFMLGHELDCIFSDFSIVRNWSLLFHGFRTSFRHHGNKWLVNRQRIRGLIEFIAVLVELDTTKPRDPSGLPISAVRSNNALYWEIADHCGGNLPISFRSINSFTGDLDPWLDHLVSTGGCRAQKYRIAQFPFYVRGKACKENTRQLMISTVYIGTQCYISGIRYHCSETPPSPKSLPHALGFSVPAGEKRIDIPPDAVVKSIEVALCATGLVGVRLIFAKNADDPGNASQWLGQSGGQGVARGVLDFPERERNYCFVAGLDAYKIVAFGFVQPHEIADNNLAYPERDDSEDNFPRSRLWVPSIPTNKKLAFSTLEPYKYHRAFDPLVNIDFGGRDGTLLPSLTRIVVHMIPNKSYIIGIDIFYTDRGVRFGRGDGTEISFFIDGPGGERIVGVELPAQGAVPHWEVHSLQISTNYGRNFTFTTLHHFLDVPKTKLCVRPPKNSVITGFIATLDITDDFFTQLGLQSQLSTQGVAQQSRDHEDFQHISQDEMKYELEIATKVRPHYYGEYYLTSASLTRVRRIAASTGGVHRSRSFAHVSGLKFDYSDHRSPAVIGQWMNEHDAVDLDKDEILQGFIIWLTKEGSYSEDSRLEEGRVVAIRIYTSHGQTKIQGLKRHLLQSHGFYIRILISFDP
ncbi:hypothetical protein FQN54_008646 [Arachnomyces sp. PD_36]|nr:hypothetical protein FQN54_008646 [Arachnomyces sp. PD_36]